MARFSALPTWWVRQLGLAAFDGQAQAGGSIAALKVLMALSVLMNFHTRKARNSFTDLEAMTGLSRPMVQRGVEILESRRILSVDRSGHVNEYELTSSDKDAGWAKLPYDKMRMHLPELSNRGAIPLAAMKIYLLLAAWRPNESTSLSASHETIRDATGVQKRHIRPALDILYSHSLIQLNLREMEQEKWRHNVYTLLGL